MHLRPKKLLPVVIVALMCGSAPTLWASHHWDDGDADDAPVSSDGAGSQAAQAERHDMSEGISAGSSDPVLPANPGNGDDQEDCGLVIKEGDVPVFDNVPCIKPIVLPPRSSLTLTR